MIRKSVILLTILASISYAKSVVTLEKNEGECRIVKSNGVKKSCFKKDSYPLNIGERVESKMVRYKDFTYTTGSSLVFVLPTPTGYRVEKGFMTYLQATYNNFMNPNKSSNEGGSYGKRSDLKKLPRKSKIEYGKNFKFKTNFKFNKCELVDADTKESLSKGLMLDIDKPIITINTNKLNRDKVYKLYIYYGLVGRHTIEISFLNEREEKIYKNFLKLEKSKQNKYMKSLYNQLELNLNLYKEGE